MKFVNCSQSDSLVAGQVYRVTFVQTEGQKVLGYLFVSFASELLAVYQRISDQNKSPYAFPVSQPPQGDNAVAIDVKIRSQEFHAGTVGDLASSLDGLSSVVDVDTVELPSRADLGTAGRSSALDQAQAAGTKTAQDTGFFAGLERTLSGLKTVILVVAIGAAVVAGAYLVSQGSKVVKAVKPSPSS